MRSLRTDADVAWTGFYLAPAPSHPNASWMPKRAFLEELGYGFAPIYVGQQQPGSPGSHALSANQGALDARNAAKLASQAGFPPTSVLYLDIETGPPPQAPLLNYYNAWVGGVRDSGFSPGVYCSHLLAADLLKHESAIVWIFHLKFPNGRNFILPLPVVDPAQSNFVNARMMQYAQQGTILLNGVHLNPVDLNSSRTADPSKA